jgi:protein ImuB
MLWVALHLPWLSLESFAATLPAVLAEAPLALADAARLITAANAAAQALGVQPGSKRASALALAPQLTIGQADAGRDAAAITALAHAALAFTPMVVVQADTVLLEVRASLRLFGGLAALLRRLQAAVAPLGHRVQITVAPTPLGAALLARVHKRLHCADRTALREALDAAPVDLLGPGREHWEALQGMGLRQLGDLRQLPRAGLARRFGAALLDELDRAYGERPDPREPIVLPAAFDSRLELFARADTTEQVLHGAGVLLARLIAWLAARHAFVRRFRLVMHHEPRWREAATPTATPLEVALAEPSRDPKHLQVLLRERLAALPLPAPTIELQLEARDIAQQAPPNGELFPTPANEREGLVRLIERLQARLGAGHVQRLEPVADHRPERATLVRAVAAGDLLRPATRKKAAPAATPPMRPLWLLTPPEPLPERRAQPLLHGQPLQLLSGPERIEAGWWDGEPAQRDYFIAQDRHGALVWIYRARLPDVEAPSGWFLQGRFA